MVKIDSQHCVKSFQQAIDQQDATKLLSMMKKGLAKTISTEKLEQIGQNYEPLRVSFASAKKMQALPGIKMDERELLIEAFFIETLFKRVVASGNYRCRLDTYDIPRTVEFDPETRLTFIHLETHNGAKVLGEGKIKRVTLSILYDALNPSLVAHTNAKHSLAREMATLRKTKGMPGIIEAIAMTHYKTSSGQLKDSIVYKLYSPGALNFNHRPALNEVEIISIARCCLTGLKSLHDAGLLHRDIKDRNIFISKTGSGIQACLADLGQTCTLADVQGHAPDASLLYNPPEAFSDWKKIDYKKAEIFSLGCVFFELAISKSYTWMKEKFLPSLLKSEGHAREKHKLKKALIEKIEHIRKKVLDSLAKHNPASRITRFRTLVISMVNPNPDARPSLEQLLQNLPM
jgi:serine/threonine protein kinase